ncbi:MAG: sensory rhodopsin transducer [Pseudobdellovibrionaceae bacterium]
MAKKILVQGHCHTRLDSRQAENALMTTIAYSE